MRGAGGRGHGHGVIVAGLVGGGRLRRLGHGGRCRRRASRGACRADNLQEPSPINAIVLAAHGATSPFRDARFSRDAYSLGGAYRARAGSAIVL